MDNNEVKQEIWVKRGQYSDQEIEVSSLVLMFQFCHPKEVVEYIDMLFHRLVEQASNSGDPVPQMGEISMTVRHIKDAVKNVKVRDKRGNPIY